MGVKVSFGWLFIVYIMQLAVSSAAQSTKVQQQKSRAGRGSNQWPIFIGRMPAVAHELPAYNASSITGQVQPAWIGDDGVTSPQEAAPPHETNNQAAVPTLPTATTVARDTLHTALISNTKSNPAHVPAAYHNSTTVQPFDDNQLDVHQWNEPEPPGSTAGVAAASHSAVRPLASSIDVISLSPRSKVAAAPAAQLAGEQLQSNYINVSERRPPPSAAAVDNTISGPAASLVKAGFQQVYSYGGSDQHATGTPAEDPKEQTQQDTRVSGFSTVYTHPALQHAAAVDGLAAALSALFQPVYLHQGIATASWQQTWADVAAELPQEALAALFTPVYAVTTAVQSPINRAATVLTAQPMAAAVSAATQALLVPSLTGRVDGGDQQTSDMSGKLGDSVAATSHSGASSSSSSSSSSMRHWAPSALDHAYSSRRSIDDLQLGSIPNCPMDSKTVCYGF